MTDFDIFLPVVWLLVAGGIIMLIDLFGEDAEKSAMFNFFTAIGGVLMAFVSLNPYWNPVPQEMMRGAMVIDQFSTYLCVSILVGTAISMFASLSYVKRIGVNLADFLIVLLLAATGMILLTVANDLIMVFLSIELLSFSIYVLTGLNGRNCGKSAEAAMKYFIMGAFSTGFLILGMAALYGMTGELQLRLIGEQLTIIYEVRDGRHVMSTLGMGSILIALAFKVGAVPFHNWVPDAYEGAPTTVTGFMAVAVKVAAFGILIRLAIVSFPAAAGSEGYFGDLGFAGWGLWVLSAASMIIGNWLAISQRNVKRMLAYSSIAHSGYILMGLAACAQTGNTDAYASVLFYLLAYTLMTSGAFAMLVYAANGERDVETIDDLKGLAWKKPIVGIGMAVFMFSMAGIPPTAGFMGKYFVFTETIKAGERFEVLAIIGILTSIMGSYYYLRVVAYTYFREGDDKRVVGRDDWGLKFALAFTVIGTLWLGVFPDKFYNAASESVKNMDAAPRVKVTIVEDIPKPEAVADKQ
ncbi:MAG: NADH-quinone oxidoreductase subunit N [Planctomycetes bacterium]|nr:NADH-quinone oxidoreductase subunit N [Planctomycetota bacterium]